MSNLVHRGIYQLLCIDKFLHLSHIWWIKPANTPYSSVFFPFPIKLKSRRFVPSFRQCDRSSAFQSIFIRKLILAPVIGTAGILFLPSVLRYTLSNWRRILCQQVIFETKTILTGIHSFWIPPHLLLIKPFQVWFTVKLFYAHLPCRPFIPPPVQCVVWRRMNIRTLAREVCYAFAVCIY